MGTRRADADLRRAILEATERLLGTRSFAELQVADVLREAGIARGSFYLYFENKNQVLHELTRRALAAAQDSARRWADDADHGRGAAGWADAAQTAVDDGIRIWGDHAPVLRAIVETWPTDPDLAVLWRAAMERFTMHTAELIDADRAARGVATVDSVALAATLTWSGERLYYLAAIGVPPFDEPARLRAALVGLWVTAFDAS